MVRLPLPMAMVGVLVALENKGEREKLVALGLLALKMFPLLGVVSHQVSSGLELLEEEEVRSPPLSRAVEEPPKIQTVWLLLSWLG